VGANCKSTLPMLFSATQYNHCVSQECTVSVLPHKARAREEGGAHLCLVGLGKRLLGFLCADLYRRRAESRLRLAPAHDVVV